MCIPTLYYTLRAGRLQVLLLTLLGSSACLSCNSDDQPIVAAENHTADILLFSKNPKGYNELYKLEDGIESPILSDNNFDFWWPKVSPDKTKLLVYRSPVNPSKNHDDYKNAELVLSNIDGTNPKVIIEKNKHEWLSQGVCRWNKDATKILMGAEIETNGSAQWRLVITDINGDLPKVISDYWAIDCNFSVDDAFVYFIGFANNNLTTDPSKFELQRGEFDAINDTLTNIVSLTSNSTRDHDPDLSPDNKRVVFSAGNANYDNVDLVLYDIETKKETVLLDDESANGGSMCWSKDGKAIYYHSVEIGKTPFRIKKVSVETSENSTVLETTDNSHGFFHPEAY